MGDVLDRRKFVNFNTLQNVRTRFTNRFKEHGIVVHCIIGNHDCYWKNNNNVNSCTEIFGDCFQVHEHPKDIIFDGMICGFVPWISNENADEIQNYLSKSNADVIFGHFELNGYEVSRGIKHEGGLSPSILSRFNQVYSGHFHCKQESGNIHYLGTAYEMFFSEVNEVKGFHVMDTETGDMEFIENPRKLYRKITYDALLDEQGHGNFNFSLYKECFIKLVVTSKLNPIKFDMFCDRLFAAEIYDLLVVDNISTQEDEGDESAISEIELSKNTIDLIDGYIDELKVDDGVDLKALMRDIYSESLSV